MFRIFVVLLLSVCSVSSTSVIGQKRGHQFCDSLVKNDLRTNFQCQNVTEQLNWKIEKYDGGGYLRYTSIVFGILEAVQRNHVDATCFKDSKRIIDGVIQRETWAVKVLDASGNKGAGFMIGNTHWLGSKITCDSIDLGYKITMSDRFQRNTVPDLLVANAPMPVQFRMVYAKHSSPWQVDMQFFEEHILHIGLCLPRSCNNSDVQTMTQNYFLNPTASAQLESLNLNATIMQVKDFKLRDGFFFKRSVIIFILAAIICVTLTGIAYCLDVEEEKNLKKTDDKTETSTLKRLVLHFSPKRNFSYIFDTSKKPQAIPIVFGLKSISSLIVLLCHVLWFGFFAMQNKAQMFHLYEELAHQWVINSQLLVDMFFVNSGFLMSYNFFKNKKQMAEIRMESVGANARRFGRMVLQRYLRFVPLYFIVTITVDIVFAYLADTSNFYMQERSELNCQRYWWRNVLFIQNFYDVNDTCISWSWSLACEIQFYVIFLLVLFVYAKNNQNGLKLFVTLASTIFLITLSVTLKMKFMPSLDVFINTRNELYTNTIARMAPYFPGVAAGWIYVMFKDQPSRVSTKNLRRIALISSFIILLLLTIDKRAADYRITATISVVERWIFATAVVSLILSNLFGHQNILTRILSAEYFVRISKLEYAIYLLNPLVATIVFGTAGGSLSVDISSLFAGGSLVIIAIYPTAVAYTMLVELPFSKLTGELFSK